jgi:SAM-dependent MidA family methyltransferase
MNELALKIASRIRAHGPMTVAQFIGVALYEPEHGYYARAAQRSGRAGDFFTSVDVGPLFGTLLARQIAEMWTLLGSLTPFEIVEAGAGNGRLAHDVLAELRSSHPECYTASRMHLVEASPAARAAQDAVLGEHAAKVVESCEQLPRKIAGVLYANELLDALPTHHVVMRDSGLREVFIVVEDGNLALQEGPLSTAAIQAYFEDADVVLASGARADVNLAATQWVRQAADALTRGFMILIDYGHETAELYSPGHAGGTFTAMRAHQHVIAPSGPGLSSLQAAIDAPGEYDLTAHVDLGAIGRTACAAGLEPLGMLDQTYFLLNLAGTDLQRPDLPLRTRLALKTLILPGSLGSTHKVLTFGRDVGRPSLRGCAGHARLT